MLQGGIGQVMPYAGKAPTALILEENDTHLQKTRFANGKLPLRRQTDAINQELLPTVA